MKIYQEKQKRFYSVTEKQCIYCNKIFIKRRQKFCSNECRKKYQELPEIKSKIQKKIQQSRVKFLKENPDKHPWKNNSKFISKPCEFLKSFLREKGYIFIEEYSPFLEKNYQIDIAFPPIKLGIEVNGNQHYDKNGNLKQYYYIRNEYFENQGWKLLEIHYSLVYNKEFILNLLNNLDALPLKEYTLSYFNKKNDKFLKYVENKKNLSIEKEKLIQNRIKLLKESNIDFNSLGWVKKVQNLLNIQHTHVRRFINSYYPELISYKRNQNLNKI